MDSWAGIPKEHLGEYWPHVFEMIAGACGRSGGRMTPELIFNDLKSGNMQLWVAHSNKVITACFVTQIIEYPFGSRCKLIIGAGNGRHQWQHHVKVLEAWAKAKGCRGMESIARKGWARIFKDWKQTHVFLEKEL